MTGVVGAAAGRDALAGGRDCALNEAIDPDTQEAPHSEAHRISRDGTVTVIATGDLLGYVLLRRTEWEAVRPGGVVVGRGGTRRDAYWALHAHVFGIAVSAPTGGGAL